jgi:enoyl-CoA hydratase/carnithine racemase
MIARHLSSSSSTPEVLVERRGSVAWLTLARPKALNALTLPMIRALHPSFEQSAADASVSCIVMVGDGGKAFCAGGDVRAVCEAAKGGGDSLPDSFFREEYALNAALAASPKPQVSVWDGIVMGGGAGVSVHGRFRVATEKTLFAMPETGIGFFPDVGATHFLPTTVGRPFGTYLALTGARLKAAELLEAGLATHFVPSDALAGLEAALQGCDGDAQVAAALAALGAGAAPPAAAPPPPRDAIERCFGPPRTAEAIVAALEAEARVPPATRLARALAPRAHLRALTASSRPHRAASGRRRRSRACAASRPPPSR